jgi:hypothetical protein
MNGVWAGYIWGEFASHTVRWSTPINVMVDASLHRYEAPRSGRSLAVAWVRSVTVQDPSSGAIFEKPSEATLPMRFEANAVGVTYGLNTTSGVDAEGLLHAYSWP